MPPSALPAMKRMSDDRYFIDTNVLLYAYDKSEVTKRARAKQWLDSLWDNSTGAVSWQVLQEFYSNAVRKFDVPADTARDLVKFMAEWNPPDVTIALIERAWHWTDQAQVSFWDGLIVAAAERSRCRFLLSEDFQAGRRFDSVTILNPFETSPPTA
jgi:predicted nucleic acid-binding protein